MNPGSLSFTAAGSAYNQSVTVAQSNNSGGFTVSPCQSAGVSIATAPASTSGVLTITPVVAGTCAFTITGTGGQTATLPVTVTTTVVNQH